MRPGPATNRLRRGALVVTGAALLLSPAAPRAEEGVCGVLDGIHSRFDEPQRTTWYRPEFPSPMTCDLRAFPEFGITGDRGRKVFLSMVLKNPPKKATRSMRIRIDGEMIPLPEEGPDVAVTRLRACQPTLWLSFGNMEEVVRRIAAASEVQFLIGKPKQPGIYPLNREDLDRFRRMVALIDTPSLPWGEAVWGRRSLELRVTEGSEGTTLPRLIPGSKANPEYPKRARRKGVMGRVVLEAMIFREGTVGDLGVLSIDGIDCGFEKSAMQAVGKWRYEPGTGRWGEPIDFYFTITVDYVLK